MSRFDDKMISLGADEAPAAAQPAPLNDGMPVSSDERHLRRLLAVRVGIPHAYFDDGEASGSEHGITIDFMREPVRDIDAKLRTLNIARAECSPPAAAQPALPEATLEDHEFELWGQNVQANLYTASQMRAYGTACAAAAQQAEPGAMLESVLCDPEGKCRIGGSDADRAVVDEALAMLKPAERMPDALPPGWVPLTLEWEPGYPEDVAFGPQRLMDRLKKWLDAHFARRAAAAQPAGEKVVVAEVGDLVIDVRERVMKRGFKNRDALYVIPPTAARVPLTLTDEQIDALMPPADGVVEVNVRRIEVLPGLMGTEYEDGDAWSLPLVRQVVRAAIEAAGQEGGAA